MKTQVLSSVGFETPERLIGYCEIHCKTPRALFHSNQINDMIKLAGNPEGWKPVTEERWLSLHEEMAELCRLARNRRWSDGEI